MSEDTARAVGSAGTDKIIIAGKECTVRPLSLKELGEIERECLNQYRENILEYSARNAKFLPEGEGSKLIREKMESMERWDVKDLPLSKVYDPDRMVVTEKLEEWLIENCSGTAPEIEAQTDPAKKQLLLRRLTATMLEAGQLSGTEYEAFTGKLPAYIKTGYVNWWITGTFAGMLELAYKAFQHNGVTRNDVSEALGRNMALMTRLAREIEALSAPQSGNT